LSRFLWIAAIGMIAPPSYGDREAPPIGYTKLTPGKRFKFVMFADFAYLGFKMPPRPPKTYPSSGLYLNNGSKTPLWAVDWYARNVQISTDGQYAVRWGKWPDMGDYRDYRTLALAFYRNGKKLKSYLVRDLVSTRVRLPITISHYQWEKASFFDMKRNLLKVTLLGGMDFEYQAGRRLVFDVTTGNIIKVTETKRVDSVHVVMP